MKVFGIGLNKTGTTSLGHALEILGQQKHISCNSRLTKYWANNNLSPIISIAEKYDNFEDWPWPLVYKELYNEFEDAKFILTKRSSAEKWYESLCKHSLKTGPTEFRRLIYGHSMPQGFKTEHIQFYNRHNKEVIKFFQQNAPDKLLVISFEDGNNWQKICGFLNKEIPKIEFPLLNRSNDNYKVMHNTTRKINRAKKKLHQLFFMT
jgi:hypothetical protein